jgi:hypothetical protein
MTLNNICEYFEHDSRLLWYFDPLSTASNNKQAATEIYHKLVDHAKGGNCVFKRNEIGYVFYSKKRRFLFFSRKTLISFCVKPEHRTKENLIKFGDFIKSELGGRFKCYIYNRNTRAINFLEKIGMKKIESNNIITLLCL